MNPNNEQENKRFDLNERLDELLTDDDEAEYEIKNVHHIEDLDSLSPEERENLNDYLEYTNARVEVAKWLSDLSVQYNDYRTNEFQKREIEQLIRKTFGEQYQENAERAINKMKQQGKIDRELAGTPDLFTTSSKKNR